MAQRRVFLAFGIRAVSWLTLACESQLLDSQELGKAVDITLVA